MDTLEVLRRDAAGHEHDFVWHCAVEWHQQEYTDVLYLSVGEPKPALGVNVGEGVILRYDEAPKEVVGMMLIGLRARLMKGLSEKD